MYEIVYYNFLYPEIVSAETQTVDITQLFLLKNLFVNLKSNSALLYNKGHNFWKSVLTWKFPQNGIFPYFMINITFKQDL